MNIYHTKKQTETISRSCSYLLLKKCFISYRSVPQYPILKAACVNYIRSWTTAVLYLFSQEIDLFIKIIMKCVNIKLRDILGCFHYILNAPRILLQALSKE